MRHHLTLIRAIIVLVLCSEQVLIAQENERPLFTNELHFNLAAQLGGLSFTGDAGNSKFSSNQRSVALEPALEYKSWRFSLPLRLGKVNWLDQGEFSGSNFQNTFAGGDLRMSYRLFGDPRKISPFFGIGVGTFIYSVNSDLLDGQGNSYFLWSDGTLRNLAESPESYQNSTILKRDYNYETNLISQQRILYYPLNFGVSSPLNNSFKVQVLYTYYLLQGDNFDANIDDGGWDKLSGIEVGISYTFGRKPSKKPVTGKPETSVESNYCDVDFNAIENQDEDGDGVSDKIDKCYGTPKGAPVDEFGCSVDSDADGIIDYLDIEPNSGANERIHSDGKSWTEEEYLNYYNDSLAYFVQTLRKINRNSRPYPVRKFIKSESYVKWNTILEEHPDWQIMRLSRSERLPAELKILDKNKDQFLSIEELEDAVEILFDNKSSTINEELIRKAIEHAFRYQ
ncbi:MAG: hypothetical protein WED33_08865 [Bacteroidia bacterium]